MMMEFNKYLYIFKFVSFHFYIYIYIFNRDDKEIKFIVFVVVFVYLPLRNICYVAIYRNLKLFKRNKKEPQPENKSNLKYSYKRVSGKKIKTFE